ncbi:hypothetical protein NDU88_000718 [Pleurodeles waltl]|uniref:Uncharacterized protein n=1 Tax=Pleurodeles waltl TaxID=8319 RepID=A0AAV7KQP5_PLEWA|nr:hypothetical protein NDU88_000718 [Pleurodeles waltl]
MGRTAWAYNALEGGSVRTPVFAGCCGGVPAVAAEAVGGEGDLAAPSLGLDPVKRWTGQALAEIRAAMWLRPERRAPDWTAMRRP